MIWFLANWRLVAKIAAGVLFLTALWYAAHRYNELIRAEAELTACRSNNTAMAEAIQKQNEAIAALKTDADKRKKLADEAMARANQSAGLKFKKAEEILASPPLTDNLCESARLRLSRGL